MSIDYKKLICNRKGDSHIHTNWTDGNDSIDEMIKSASLLNLEWIIFSEHNREDSFYSYKEFINDVHTTKVNKNNLILINGAECKIKNFEGDLDISSEAELFADIITGVVHRFPGEKGNIMKKNPSVFTLNDKNEALLTELKLSIAGIRSNNFSILGHPFGMTIRRFGLVPELEKFEELIIECIENDIIFEINLRYHIKIINNLVFLLNKLGAKWTIGSNSHSKVELKNTWDNFKLNNELVKI
tara:strand:- start:959 stop:1687 length:729 start_codon:yes stop_codon:yes gene_type:complete